MGTTSRSFPHNTHSHSQETMAKRPADELLNGTTFDYVVSTSPRAYTTERKVNFNTTVHTVCRVVVVKLRVARKHKSPEGITFVPLFLTTDGDLLEPSTCDAVGRLVDDSVQLNPTFVHLHENATKRVKALTVRFEMEEDLDLLTHLDLPDYVASSMFNPVARKCAVKKYPGMGRGKVASDVSTPNESDEDLSKDEAIDCLEEDEEDGSGTDLDEDLPKRPSGKDPTMFGFHE